MSVGHSCEKCGRKWASNACFEVERICSNQPIWCPPCNPNSGWRADEWRYVVDPFIKWVKEIYEHR